MSNQERINAIQCLQNALNPRIAVGVEVEVFSEEEKKVIKNKLIELVGKLF